MDPNHGREAMHHAAMAAAAALSNPFFLAAAAASSRDGSHSSIEQSSTARIPSFDEHHHHHLQSSSPTSIIPTNKLFERPSTITKRSLSPSLLSKQQQSNGDNVNSLVKRSATTMNTIQPTCFTPVTTNTSPLSSPGSKLKIIAKGKKKNKIRCRM